MPYSSTPMFGSGDSLSPELLAQLQAAYTPQNSGAFDWSALFNRPTFGGLQLDPIYDSPDGSGAPTRWMARDPNNKNPEAYYHTYGSDGKYAGDYQGTKAGVLDGPLIPALLMGGALALTGGLGGAGAAAGSSGSASGAGTGGLLGDATAAGYGGLDAASAATMGGGASINGGAALGTAGGAAGLGGAAGSAGGASGGASSGLGSLLAGNGGTLAKLATGLLGAALGGKQPTAGGANGTGQRHWDTQLDPYLWNGLSVGQSIFNRPVAANGFNTFYKG